MSIKQAYNSWASQYDTNLNKTRDLEAIALRTTLERFTFDSVLEAGCGTGKNTEWFITKARHITAIDLSEQMLARARNKINSPFVEFKQTDITKPWAFRNRLYDLVSFSLVLEHIKDLDPVISEAAAALNAGGYMYIGELHPFKQYTGSKARFESDNGLQIVECYNHHISDFILAGKNHGLRLIELEEYFDNDNREELPRILSIVMQKQ
jgi:ubiquinone/menaquinone biosynthesis C-methylase UbiE